MDERTHSPGGPAEGPRPPGRDDLTRLCAELNRLGARYVVVGGFAGVRIPFASPLTLWKMKQTHREKDIPDRMFLRQLLAAQGIQVEDTPPPQPPTGLRAWLRRTFGG